MTQFELLKRYIEGVAKGYSNSLVVVSSAGFGKSETTLATLKNLGLKENQDFIYTSNYITPVELFLLLQENSNKIIVLDDCEDTLRDPKAIGILKGALWSVVGKKRIVNWLSGTYRIKNKSFEFSGKMIFLLNQINEKSSLIRALKDRGLYLELSFTKQELVELMRKKIENDYQNVSSKVKNDIVEIIQKYGNNISLRTLPKAIQLYLLSPNHYQHLIVALLTEKT
jgi:hypothetical protein